MCWKARAECLRHHLSSRQLFRGIPFLLHSGRNASTSRTRLNVAFRMPTSGQAKCRCSWRRVNLPARAAGSTSRLSNEVVMFCGSKSARISRPFRRGQGATSPWISSEAGGRRVLPTTHRRISGRCAPCIRFCRVDSVFAAHGIAGPAGTPWPARSAGSRPSRSPGYAPWSPTSTLGESPNQGEPWMEDLVVDKAEWPTVLSRRPRQGLPSSCSA